MMASPNTRTTVLPWDDVKLGAVLGEGSYSAVHAVSTLPHGSVLLEATETGGSKHYALKRLHAKILCDEKMCRAASADMAAEATILAILPLHENIIRLRAISTGFWDCPEEGFLLLDRSHETLDRRLCRLNNQKIRVVSPLFGRIRQRCREQQAWVSYAAIGIAKGMEFLHRHGVIYRDLKPANIGFDQEGRVQIFDF
jgi:serine/threonine protein kinase